MRGTHRSTAADGNAAINENEQTAAVVSLYSALPAVFGAIPQSAIRNPHFQIRVGMCFWRRLRV